MPLPRSMDSTSPSPDEVAALTRFLRARNHEDEVAALTRFLRARNHEEVYRVSEQLIRISNQLIAWSRHQGAPSAEESQRITEQLEELREAADINVARLEALAGEPDEENIELLRNMAACFDGHPDYNESWKP